MLHSEEDINFKSISDTLFEELCYDLLIRLGFHSLEWRQGPADEGRDVQGRFRLLNPLIGDYEERWFFECKNYSSGVDKSALTSAIEWADVEEPDHLVLLVAPHVTNQCRTWIDKKRQKASYKIHLIEEKRLKTLLLQYDELIERYFLNKLERLFRNSFIDWVAIDIFPGLERLKVICSTTNLEHLTREEIAFLLITAIDGERSEVVKFATFFSKVLEKTYSLAQIAKTYIWQEDKSLAYGEAYSYLTTHLDFDGTQKVTILLHLPYQRNNVKYKGYYILSEDYKGRMLEVLIGKIISTGKLDVVFRLILPKPETPSIETYAEQLFPMERFKKDIKKLTPPPLLSF